MHYNGNDAVRNIMNPQKKLQKNKNIYQANLKIYQSPSQQYQNLVYSNNNNIINYNLKGNKVKNPKKEKVIEGDLNFNNNIKRINHNKVNNNSMSKKVRNQPRKSPIPIPKDYKPSNFPFQKLLGNNFQMKPKSSFQRKNNFIGNNKNNIKPNILGINSNFPSNKTYNTFNIFKKDLERTRSPLLRSSGTNNGINFMQKGSIKSRYISKSPILSKGSIFNRYKMYGFPSSSNNTSTSSTSNNQKKKKKTPLKNNQKKVQAIPKSNNINNLRTKGTTLISGEIIQDSSNNGKLNVNNINRIQNQNNDMINIKPVYNPKSLKIESNNALLNIHPDNNKVKEEQMKKSKENNEHKDKKENKDNKENCINNNNIKKNNENDVVNVVNKKNNETKNDESKKNNHRSLSQGIIDPLQKNSKDGAKDKEKEQKQNNIKNDKEKETQKDASKEANKIIKKKIKDILPFTHVGFDGEEPKENNQDIYFIYKNFMNHKDYIYMSVCDGHGVEGHFVSDFIKEILPYDMSENLKNLDILSEADKEKTYQRIKETFINANEKLVDNEDINSLFSGSTCVSVIYTPEKLIVPNIGDSRAVLGRLVNKEKNEYRAINLSRDHKPIEKDEAQRIIENDGRIQPFTEDGEFVGPERVWIKEDEVPGLAMTRSFGDRVAATVGVMSEPEIKEFKFEEGDKFMIIASDGIWEFISSQECVDIIKDFYDKNDLKGCCEYLYQESSKRWLKEEEVIDDTTLILVFFE